MITLKIILIIISFLLYPIIDQILSRKGRTSREEKFFRYGTILGLFIALILIIAVYCL